MLLKHNPKPLTKNVFNNIKLDEIKSYYDRIYRKLNIKKQPIKVLSTSTKDTYLYRLLQILNNNEYYFVEGNLINKYWIGYCFDKVKQKMLIKKFNDEQQIMNPFMISDEERPPMKIDIVNQRLEELINNLIIEEEEKEKESIINANQTIQNDIFFSPF